MTETNRSAITRLLEDSLALQTAQALGLVKMPDQIQMDVIRQNTAATAETLVRTLERDIVTSEMKLLIIKDVKSSLMHRTKLDRAAEIMFFVTSFLAAVVVGAGQFVFLPELNMEAVKTTYYVVLALIVVNVLCIAYVRFAADNKG